MSLCSGCVPGGIQPSLVPSSSLLAHPCEAGSAEINLVARHRVHHFAAKRVQIEAVDVKVGLISH